MRTAALLLAAFAVTVASRAPAGVIPPANGYKSSITKPTSPTGTDWSLTKASQTQVKLSTGNVSFTVKLNGVLDTMTSTPVNQMGNTFEVQFVVPNAMGGSTTHTKDFAFDLVAGKTINTQTKFNVGTGDTATWGKVLSPGDAIEMRAVRVIQGGSGLGAGNVFGVAGLTTK